MTWFEFMCMQCHNLFIFSMFSHKSCQLWILVSVKDVGLTSMSCTPLMLVFISRSVGFQNEQKVIEIMCLSFIYYCAQPLAGGIASCKKLYSHPVFPNFGTWVRFRFTCRWDLFLQKVMQCSPILAHAWGLDSPNAFCNHIFSQNDYNLRPVPKVVRYNPKIYHEYNDFMWRLNVEGLSAVSFNHTYRTHVLYTPSLKLHVK